MFYCVNSKKVYESVRAFLLDHKDTSYGEMDTEEERNIFGLFHLHRRFPPYDPKLQDITEGGIVLIEGKWTQTYQVVDKLLTYGERASIFNGKLEDAANMHYDAVAGQKQYTSHVMCLVRAGYNNPWRAEAQAFGEWMDKCNADLYKIMNEITVGERSIPEDYQPFIDALPPMVWP